MSLTNRILLAMLAGIALGSLLDWLMGAVDPDSGLFAFIEDGLILGLFDVVGRIFIASLKLLVVPLVMVSLICGMSSLGAGSRMGSIAGRTVGLYLFTTCVAVSLGLTAALLIGPGKGVEAMTSAAFEAKPPPPLTDTLVNIFPSNPFKAMAEGQMLQVIVFALLVGFALTRAGEAGERIAGWFRDMEVIVMKMVGILIELAPYGVFALLTKLFATMGFGTIIDLAAYFFTLLGVLLFHGLVVYTSLLKTLTGLSPRILLQKMRRVWAFAFSTASSGATLPITLRVVEKRLGVSKSVAGFSVPLGAVDATRTLCLIRCVDDAEGVVSSSELILARPAELRLPVAVYNSNCRETPTHWLLCTQAGRANKVQSARPGGRPLVKCDGPLRGAHDACPGTVRGQRVRAAPRAENAGLPAVRSVRREALRGVAPRGAPR